MRAFGISHTGKVRSVNQDAFRLSLDPEAGTALAVLCDGMGGVSAGEIASAAAAETFMDTAGAALCDEKQEAAALGRKAVEAANLRVYELSQSEERYRGMGTTLVAALLRPRDAAVVNVGDSRCYWLSEGELQQVTRDHSLVQELLDKGLITAPEARSHPRRNLITRAVGLEKTIRTDVFRLELREGERLLLCSDGLSNLVPEEELRALLREEEPERCCERLLELALDRGAPDNVTAVLLER